MNKRGSHMNKRGSQGSARTPCLYKNEVAPE